MILLKVKSVQVYNMLHCSLCCLSARYKVKTHGLSTPYIQNRTYLQRSFCIFSFSHSFHCQLPLQHQVVCLYYFHEVNQFFLEWCTLQNGVLCTILYCMDTVALAGPIGMKLINDRGASRLAQCTSVQKRNQRASNALNFAHEAYSVGTALLALLLLLGITVSLEMNVCCVVCIHQEDRSKKSVKKGNARPHRVVSMENYTYILLWQMCSSLPKSYLHKKKRCCFLIQACMLV